MGIEINDLPKKYQDMARRKLKEAGVSGDVLGHNEWNREETTPQSVKPTAPLTHGSLGNEGSEQEALFDWAKVMEGRFPELRLLYHVPNEGKRSRTYGGKLLREGLKPGVPDICLPSARGSYHGLYIEMKAIRGKPTEDQEQWIRDLRSEGYRAEICYGFQEAKEVIEEYLTYPKASQMN